MQDKRKLTEEQIESAEQKIRRSSNFQKLFSDKEKSLLLEEIDRFTSFRTDTFDQDPYINAYNAGKRSTAVFIHNILDQDVELAREILKQEKEK